MGGADAGVGGCAGRVGDGESGGGRWRRSRAGHGRYAAVPSRGSFQWTLWQAGPALRPERARRAQKRDARALRAELGTHRPARSFVSALSIRLEIDRGGDDRVRDVRGAITST